MAQPPAEPAYALGSGPIADRYAASKKFDELAGRYWSRSSESKRLDELARSASVEEYKEAQKYYGSANAVDQVNDGVDQEYAVITKFDVLIAKLQGVARALDELAVAAQGIHP